MINMLFSDQSSDLQKVYDGGGAMIALPIKQPVSGMLYDAANKELSECAIQMIKPDDMHITLAYLGESRKLQKFPYTVMAQTFAALYNPFNAKISGVGVFCNDYEDVVYATVDSLALNDFQKALEIHLVSNGLPYEKRHGFQAHITLAYCKKGKGKVLSIDPVEFVFSSIILGWNDRHDEFELRSPSSNYTPPLFTRQDWVQRNTH